MTTPATFNGEALRVCTDCDPNHYDNCDVCFGFGVKPATETHEAPPISAGDADDMRNGTNASTHLPCPNCKSTINGIPK